jgi:hypothetical protein
MSRGRLEQAAFAGVHAACPGHGSAGIVTRPGGSIRTRTALALRKERTE